MPYARRSYRKKTFRKSASSIKSVARRRPTASNQKSQILSLSKKVNQISRLTKSTIERQQFYQAYVRNISSDLTIQNITPKNSWVAVFGANENLNEAHNLVVDNLHLKYTITPGNEEALCNVTMFVISPKSKKVLEETSSLTSFVSGTDYVNYDGLCLFNTKRFKIHAYRRTMTLMQQNVETSEEAGSYTPLIQKGNMGSIRLKINHKIKNTLGVWSDVTQDELPYYMHTAVILANNNSAIDLAYPEFTATALWKTHALR